MENNHYKGKLKRWNDAKGFGFISPDNGHNDVFIHISALSKISRRPIVGDAVVFQIETDGNGKKRAVNAKLEGVSVVQSKNNKINKKAKNKFVSRFLSIMLLILIGTLIFNKITEKTNSSVVKSSSIGSFQEKERNIGNFTCSGKTLCSEMNSCEEAKFYQRNCPSTKMDGDGDYIPCERQWCGF